MSRFRACNRKVAYNCKLAFRDWGAPRVAAGSAGPAWLLLWMKAMRGFWGTAAGLLISLCACLAVAEEITPAQVSQLDNDVQEAKAAVLDIASDLALLEERLNYPEATRLEVFLMLGKEGEIVASRLRIDGKEAASHAYAFPQAEALRRGGAQRIYMGNIKPGQHAIEVTVASRTKDNLDHWHTASYRFFKRSGMKTIEISVAGLDTETPAFAFRD